MALDIVGKIVQVLDLQTGTSARGDWKKQEFILETEEQYPRKICISLWGDRVGDITGIQLGKELITVSVAIESREFNGRWYTDVRGWRIQRGVVTATAAPVVAGGAPVVADAANAATPATDDFVTTGGEESFDDLPF
ncbi:MAG: DUF3127 domain-containing protein [Prevotellaceae bacterium]|jgi:hypothetical protein|nr:DUF3127 domain-containing protein [Prevotellaceae bacterium]